MSKEDREARGRTRGRNTGGATHPIANDGGGFDSYSNGSSRGAAENRKAACTALSNLFLRQDGWLRAIPAGDGKALYLKWKFSRGPHRGHYVMAVVEVWQWDYGVQLLEDKCAAVDVGALRPVKDPPYAQQFEAYND